MLVIEQKEYSYDDIKKGNFSTDTAYALSVLQFCNEWLNGKDKFSLHTSGSTGTPKEIVITREQMTFSAWMTIRAMTLSAKDKALVAINTSYIGGKMMLVRSMEADMKMTVVPPSSNPLQEFSNESHFDFTALVPLQIETMLLKNGKEKDILDQMKAIIIGGATVSPQLEKLIQDVHAPVYSTYAMTETVSHIALQRLNGKERSPYYHVLPGVTIGTTEQNTLTISSPVTNNELLVTNDVVELIDEKTFRWVGRADNVINSGGVKIFPEELESQIQVLLSNLKITNRFFCFGSTHSQLGQAVQIVFEGASFTTEQEDKIKDAFAKGLSKYSVPKQFFYYKAFKQTETGKINRSATVSSLTSQ